MEWLDCAAFKLKPVDFKVAFVVMQYVNEKTGDCYPSVDTIARKCGMSERHVTRALKRLCDSGWLERTRRPNNSNVYAPLYNALNRILDEMIVAKERKAIVPSEDSSSLSVNL